ncbi:hypothetical protein D3C71_1992900 [compost metagenome]
MPRIVDAVVMPSVIDAMSVREVVAVFERSGRASAKESALGINKPHYLPVEGRAGEHDCSGRAHVW